MTFWPLMPPLPRFLRTLHAQVASLQSCLASWPFWTKPTQQHQEGAQSWPSVQAALNFRWAAVCLSTPLAVHLQFKALLLNADEQRYKSGPQKGKAGKGAMFPCMAGLAGMRSYWI